MDLIKGDENIHELLQAQAHVWNHSLRFISSMSLKCAVQLEIPDIIHNHGQPMTISELALALSIQPSKVHCVYRLMRILVHSGFFAEKAGQSGKENGYVLTLASRLLLKDNPLSARPFLLAMLDPILMKPWQYVNAWFQSDNDHTVFSTAHGSTMWDYTAVEPRLNNFFNAAMASDGLLAASVVLGKCKGVFEGLKSLVDVGGGTGTITKVLAEAFPQMNCTVFDLPHVVAGLQGSENLKYLGGNMFEKVPPGDAVMLKWILHDWSDDDCIKILKKCKEAIGSKDEGGKVIIIDMIMGNQEVDEEAIETKLFFDMQMMVVPEGQERNEQEWSRLFVYAGYSDYKIHHILGLRSLIELFP
ncbi:trans-resveratrol di-O-methyltransferase-like [Durio zibethinus]|uniref:Trans-resveratrol di-O-methyltransferase-like n=1 Tax=Durio zibethinus TaxID=66656 RepID=A0A6P5ZL73_DURZI|nr:trans-resveratrol di-O-methyltransferase-like [Durio zibethinus]